MKSKTKKDPGKARAVHVPFYPDYDLLEIVIKEKDRPREYYTVPMRHVSLKPMMASQSFPCTYAVNFAVNGKNYSGYLRQNCTGFHLVTHRNEVLRHIKIHLRQTY